MPGVVFLICVPTPNYERVLLNGLPNNEAPPRSPKNFQPESPPILRMEVELRDKKLAPAAKRLGQKGKEYSANPKRDIVTGVIPMEKVLDELLRKLDIEHVIWTGDKNGNYYQVVFPCSAGIPCETTIHCLTELGIGLKLNSTISVMPTSVSYEGNEHPELEDE